MSRKIDITGQRFGDWTVLGEAPSVGRQTYWLCRCSCGTEKNVEGYSLRSGKTRRCTGGVHKRTSIDQKDRKDRSSMDPNEYFYILTIGWSTDGGYVYATDTGTYDMSADEHLIDIFYKLRTDLVDEHDAPATRVHVHTWIFQPNTGLYRG